MTKVSIGDVIDAAGKVPIRYVCDFGNDWGHLIETVTIGDPTPGNLYP